MTTPDRTDLTMAVHELTAAPNHLLLNLHMRIRHTGSAQQENPGGKKPKPQSSSPWNDQAAGLYFDIHAGARRHESALTLLLEHTARYRPDTHAATVAALDALPDLVVAAAARYPDHRVPAAAARDLTGWPRLVRIHLDEARAGEVPWTKAPGGLTCPYCERRLLLQPGWQSVSEPPLWCRGCPARLEGEEALVRVDRDWPAGAWIAVLNQQTA